MNECTQHGRNKRIRKTGQQWEYVAGSKVKNRTERFFQPVKVEREVRLIFDIETTPEPHC